jgi:hypothetical protein
VDTDTTEGTAIFVNRISGDLSVSSVSSVVELVIMLAGVAVGWRR